MKDRELFGAREAPGQFCQSPVAQLNNLVAAAL
jgi:hypothetical protein